MKSIKIKCLVILTLLLFISLNVESLQSKKIINRACENKEIFTVYTEDMAFITLTRYNGSKKPPILLIHGMSGNHLSFDWDENHSLARFLNKAGWDVWMLDMRTHDCDGDFLFSSQSNREYINRFWDFDNTLLKIDVVTAVDFVKNKTGCDKIFLAGHSYGGYLAYAYAMIIGEENLSGIISIGACPYANPKSFQDKKSKDMFKYGFYFKEKAYIRLFGRRTTGSFLKIFIDRLIKNWDEHDHSHIFYKNTTPLYIQKKLFYTLDSEPAGVYVDMIFGKDPYKYHGYWVDPQTLYNYSYNLYKITVPILFIAGDNDTQDPAEDIYKAFENVSSKFKEFYTFPKHSHMDLLLGDECRELIFPKIDNFMNNVHSRCRYNTN